MVSLADISAVLVASFTDIWFKVVGVIPAIIGAIIIFVVGVFVSRLLGRFVAVLLQKIYVDRAVATTGLKTLLERVGFKMEVSAALGLLVTWFLYAVTLVAAADVLGLSQISEFLRSVVLYIPNVIIAVVILVVGIIISTFVQTLVKETATAAGVSIADFLADVARWAILVFTVMAALIQLNVATQLTQILFTGAVFMVALAGGIAFGLGGKDKAKEIIDKLSRK